MKALHSFVLARTGEHIGPGAEIEEGRLTQEELEWALERGLVESSLAADEKPAEKRTTRARSVKKER